MSRPVATGFCRLTVVASRTRADVALPDSVPVAGLLPDLLRMVAEPAAADVVGWQLTRLGEPPLPAEATLAESGVLEGEILYLVSQRAAPPPPVVEDLVDVVGDVLGTNARLWMPTASRRLLVTAGAAVAAGGAVLLAVDGVPGLRPVIVALAIGAVLLAVAAALRVLTAGFGSLALALAALPYGGVAALGLAPHGGVGLGPGQWAFAALGVVVAALLAMACAPAATGPAAAVVAAGLTMAIGGAAMSRYPVSVAQVAAVTAPIWLAMIAILPGLVARVTGVASVGLRSATSAAEITAVRDAAVSAHRLLTWLLTAAAAVVASCAALLAVDGTAARWLAAAVGVAVALRARSLRALTEVLPLAVGAIGCLLAVEVAAAARAGAGQRHGLFLAIALGTAALLLLAAAALSRPTRGGAALERALDRIETVVALAVVPLMLGVLGVYGSAAEAARRLN